MKKPILLLLNFTIFLWNFRFSSLSFRMFPYGWSAKHYTPYDIWWTKFPKNYNCSFLLFHFNKIRKYNIILIISICPTIASQLSSVCGSLSFQEAAKCHNIYFLVVTPFCPWKRRWVFSNESHLLLFPTKEISLLQLTSSH